MAGDRGVDGGKGVDGNRIVRIQKPFALSPRLISKSTEMSSRVFMSVSPVNIVGIVSFFL